MEIITGYTGKKHITPEHDRDIHIGTYGDNSYVLSTGMKSFYPKGNWVKWKSRIEESVESLIKWAFEKTVNKSWQNR